MYWNLHGPSRHGKPSTSETRKVWLGNSESPTRKLGKPISEFVFLSFWGGVSELPDFVRKKSGTKTPKMRPTTVNCSVLDFLCQRQNCPKLSDSETLPRKLGNSASGVSEFLSWSFWVSEFGGGFWFSGICVELIGRILIHWGPPTPQENFSRTMLRKFCRNHWAFYFCGSEKLWQNHNQVSAEFPCKKSREIHRRASAGAQGEILKGGFVRGRFWRMCPRSVFLGSRNIKITAFFCQGGSAAGKDCLGHKGTSAKSTLLETTLLRTSEGLVQTRLEWNPPVSW